MPYIDPTGFNKGWSLEPQEGLGLIEYVEAIPKPERAVPQSVSRYQARAALHEAELLSLVEAYFSGLPASSLGRLAWQEAPTVSRNSEALLAAATALGLSEDQIDELFIRAAQFL